MVGAYLSARLVARHLGMAAFLFDVSPYRVHSQRAAGYGVGVFASVWLIDRVTGFWG